MSDAALARIEDKGVDREDERLKALERYDILDTPEEVGFERIAALVQTIFGVDTSVVSMIDGHRQWYKAKRGLDLSEVPLVDTFCKVTMAQDSMLVVEDAKADARFSDNPFVNGPSPVRFYAGTPMKTLDGHTVGTLCAIDKAPREFSERDQLILSQLAQIAVSELELRLLATTDGLTGIMTRRAFKEEGGRLVTSARKHRRGLAAIAFDLDHFKAINDTYGHAAGDTALKSVTKAVAGVIGPHEILGRLGGEEFAVLAPDMELAAGMALAERMRVAIRALKFPGSKPPIALSATFGVATLDAGADDLDSLLAKADEALNDGKRQGRNRTLAWSGSTTSTTKPVARRRVLKAGKLIFNNHKSVTDCTVRSLWENGAEVAVSSTAGIPDEIALGMRSDGTEWKAKVVQRGETTLELAFV